ncbi:MAG: acyl-CoA/acyl-ACP dehydrogenase, partial [Hamadaea sp.]|nr:acyl-CoA/acyl-ACP dehydrogenase [Hamadaea sp.]
MGIGLTEEHRALAASVRGLAGRTVEHRALAAQGLLGLHLPEAYGGQGFGLVELCVALEALGERRAPGPYLPTVLASAALACSPPLSSDRQPLLHGLATGSLTAAVVLMDPGVALGAAGADLFLVPVADGWALLDRDDVSAEPAEGVDLDRDLCTVTVRDVPAERVLGPVPVRELAALLLAADSCGLAAWAVETAASYAKVREQFGRPIGQFQGVKH